MSSYSSLSYDFRDLLTEYCHDSFNEFINLTGGKVYSRNEAGAMEEIVIESPKQLIPLYDRLVSSKLSDDNGMLKITLSNKGALSYITDINRILRESNLQPFRYEETISQKRNALESLYLSCEDPEIII